MKKNKDVKSAYSARIQPIQGFTLKTLIRLLRKHGWDKNKQNIKRVSYLFSMGCLLSALAWREKRIFHDRVKKTPIQNDPVFIIGHWRSGTTHLHNLLIQNTHFTYVRNYQSIFAPCFLLPRVRKFSHRLDNIVKLDTRPMDNIPFGTQEPWEDEFILTALTGISPLIRVMFPRYYAQKGYKYNDAETAYAKSIWQKKFKYLLQRLTFLENKQILLKSPTHTARINGILRSFPNSKFVFIVRNPYNVYKSNEILWENAYALSHLQAITKDEIDEYILSTYEYLHDTYINEKANIPDNNLIEIKYEDLDLYPRQTVQEIYETFEIPFDRIEKENLNNYISSIKNYKKNQYQIDQDTKRRVYNRWNKYFDYFNYCSN